MSKVSMEPAAVRRRRIDRLYGIPSLEDYLEGGARAAAARKAAARVRQRAAADGEVEADREVELIIKAAVAKAVRAQKATDDATIAALRARIDTLANAPRPGGPMARAVASEKTVAGLTSPAGNDIDPKQVIAVLEDAAKHATSDHRRQRRATERATVRPP